MESPNDRTVTGLLELSIADVKRASASVFRVEKSPAFASTTVSVTAATIASSDDCQQRRLPAIVTKLKMGIILMRIMQPTSKTAD